MIRGVLRRYQQKLSIYEELHRINLTPDQYKRAILFMPLKKLQTCYINMKLPHRPVPKTKKRLRQYILSHPIFHKQVFENDI